MSEPVRFPVRCAWAGHDAPAAVVLTVERPCGHPDPRLGMAYTCSVCAGQHPVGKAADNPSTCPVCGVSNRATVTASRPLNEGDLP